MMLSNLLKKMRDRISAASFFTDKSSILNTKQNKKNKKGITKWQKRQQQKEIYDTTIKTYFYLAETGKEIPERLTQYTRRVAKRIVEYLIKRKRTEDAAKFIKVNLLSPNAMESLHRLAVDLKRTDIAAYLMEAINAREKKTSMRL